MENYVVAVGGLVAIPFLVSAVLFIMGKHDDGSGNIGLLCGVAWCWYWADLTTHIPWVLRSIAELVEVI